MVTLLESKQFCLGWMPHWHGMRHPTWGRHGFVLHFLGVAITLLQSLQKHIQMAIVSCKGSWNTVNALQTSLTKHNARNEETTGNTNKTMNPLPWDKYSEARPKYSHLGLDSSLATSNDDAR